MRVERVRIIISNTVVDEHIITFITSRHVIGPKCVCTNIDV